MAYLSAVEIGFQDNDITDSKDGNPQWTLVKEVPWNEPCIFILGGNGTRAKRKGANGYARTIKTALAQNMDKQSVRNLKVYGAAWDFGRIDIGDKEAKKIPREQLETHDEKLARSLKFEQYGHKNTVKPDNEQHDPTKLTLIEGILALYPVFMAMGSVYADYIADMLQRMIDNALADTINPQYIQQLFDVLILPRISDNGKKLDKDEAIKRIRNVTIWAHCHGAYVFLSLEELMQKKMVELGYTPTEMHDIQKQLFCVAFAPVIPLGKSKSTILSFASMYDRFLMENHNNIFTWYMKHYRQEVADKDRKHGMTGKVSTEKDVSYLVEDATNNQIAYFPDKQGNVFIFPHLGDIFEDYVEINKINNGRSWALIKSEHNLEYKEKNPYAVVWRTLMTNALGNSLKSAVDGTLLPDTKDLVTNLDYKYIKIEDTNDHRHAHDFMQLDAEMNAGPEIQHKERKIDENAINKQLSELYGISEPRKKQKKDKDIKTDVTQDIKYPDEQMLDIIFDTAKQNGIDIYNEMKKLRFIKGQGTIKQQIDIQNNWFIKQNNKTNNK